VANRWQNSGCTCSGPDPTVLTILVSMISPSTTYQEAFAVAASAVVVYSIRISNRCVCLPCIFVGNLMLEYGIEIRRPPTSKILLLETQSICVGFFAVLLLVRACKCLSRISFIWASSVLFVVVKRSLTILWIVCVALLSIFKHSLTIFRIFCVALLVTNSICQSTARKVGCFFFGTPRWRLPEMTEAREWA
jgi:hypothetical protein